MLNHRFFKSKSKKVKQAVLASMLATAICGAVAANGHAVVNRSSFTGQIYRQNYHNSPSSYDWWFIDNNGYTFYGQEKTAYGNKDEFNGEENYKNVFLKTFGSFKEDDKEATIGEKNSWVADKDYNVDIAASSDHKYLYGLAKDGGILIADLTKSAGERRLYSNYEIESGKYAYVSKNKKNMTKHIVISSDFVVYEDKYSALSVDSDNNLLVGLSQNDVPMILKISKSQIDKEMNSDKSDYLKAEPVSKSLNDMGYENAEIQDMTSMSINGVNDYLLTAINKGNQTELVLFNPPINGKYEKYEKIGTVVDSEGKDVVVTGMTTANRQIYITTDKGAFVFEKTPGKDIKADTKHKIVPVKFVERDREGNITKTDDNIIPHQLLHGAAEGMNMYTGDAFTGAGSAEEGVRDLQADPYNDFKLNLPKKTEVADRTKITPEEIEKIKDAVMESNKDLEKDKIEVNPNGGSVTYTKKVGDHDEKATLSGEDVVIEKVFVNPPKLTKVKNIWNLSDDEKAKVKQAILDRNQQLKDEKENIEIAVDRDGYTTVDVKETAKHSSKNVAFKQSETVIKIPALTKVDNKNKLSDKDRENIKKAIIDANPHLKDMIDSNKLSLEVDEKGVATVKGKDGEQAKFEQNETVVQRPEKTVVKDLTKLSDDEKKAVKAAIIKANPELKDKSMEVKDNGETVVHEGSDEKSPVMVTFDPEETVKSMGNSKDTGSELIKVNAPEKTVVNDPENLTDGEIKSVKEAFKNANPELSDDEFIVEKDGTVKVNEIKDGKIINPATGFEAKTFNPKDTIAIKINDPELTEVKNKESLTDEEKNAVKKAVIDKNSGLKEENITVKDNGEVEIKDVKNDKGISFEDKILTQDKTVFEKKAETSERGIQTDKPSTSDGEAQTDKPSTSDGEAQTDKPSTSDREAQTDKPSTSDGEAQTDKPSTSDGEVQTDKPSTSDAGAQTDKPSKLEEKKEKKDNTSKDKKKHKKTSNITSSGKTNSLNEIKKDTNSAKNLIETYTTGICRYKNIEDRVDFINGRIFGPTRYATASKISVVNRCKSKVVIVANGKKFTDVLTAVPYAHELNCPILYTTKDSIPKETADEIKRLGAEKVIIVGGEDSVSRGIKTEFERNYTVERVGGINRYETSEFVATRVRDLSNIKDKAIMASGEIYPDALTISSLATKENLPILITAKERLPYYTSKFIKDKKIDKLVYAGGYSAVSRGIESETSKIGAKMVVRYGGSDRYETSAIIAKAVRGDAKYSLYASGQDFADALVSGVIGGDLKAPTLLVKKNELPESVKNVMKHVKAENRIIVGGYNSVSKEVEKEIRK